MSKDETIKSVDNALTHVSKNRRKFLKGMLIGSAALAVLPLMKSDALARQEGGSDTPPPEGKAKGKGGKGKGAKGKGKGDEGGSTN